MVKGERKTVFAVPSVEHGNKRIGWNLEASWEGEQFLLVFETIVGELQIGIERSYKIA